MDYYVNWSAALLQPLQLTSFAFLAGGPSGTERWPSALRLEEWAPVLTLEFTKAKWVANLVFWLPLTATYAACALAAYMLYRKDVLKIPTPARAQAALLFLVTTMAITVSSNQLKTVNCTFPRQANVAPYIVSSGGDSNCWDNLSAVRGAASLVAFGVYFVVGIYITLRESENMVRCASRECYPSTLRSVTDSWQ